MTWGDPCSCAVRPHWKSKLGYPVWPSAPVAPAAGGTREWVPRLSDIPDIPGSLGRRGDFSASRDWDMPMEGLPGGSRAGRPGWRMRTAGLESWSRHGRGCRRSSAGQGWAVCTGMDTPLSVSSGLPTTCSHAGWMCVVRGWEEKGRWRCTHISRRSLPRPF